MFVFILFCKIICISPITSKRFVYNKSLIIILSKKKSLIIIFRKIPSKYPMWDSSHTHTHHTINQIRASQSPPLKSLTSSLGLTLWGSVSELTQDYRVGSDTISNDPRKNARHICTIP